MMISSPNIVGLRTSMAASRTTSSRLRSLAFAMRQVPDHVLDHDHGAIDDQAEVERPQAQQAAGDAELQHAGEGEQHRQRNGQGDDQPGPQVAEEDEQHRDDQQAALEQVLAHRVDDVVDQLGAVVDGLRPRRRAASSS